MINPLCGLLGIEVPILLGGMMFVGRPALAAAVSEAGGLGILGAGRMTPEGLQEALAEMRGLTDRPFGVNLPLRSSGIDLLVDAAIEHRVKIVSTSAGNPGLYTGRLKDAGTIVIHVAATVAQARKSQEAGADAVVAEGGESGGFSGRDQVSTMALVPQVADVVQVPVIAAGGITDGRGVAAAFALGALGVQLGTRFLAASECVLPAAYKQSILQARDTDTRMALNASGAGRRVLKRELVEEASGFVAGADKTALAGLGSVAEPNAEAKKRGYSAGQGAGLIHEVLPAGEIVQKLMREARQVAAGMPGLVPGKTPRA